MEPSSSPNSKAEPSEAEGSAQSLSVNENENGKKKKPRKKRKAMPAAEGDEIEQKKPKKTKPRRKGDEGRPKKGRKKATPDLDFGLTPAQRAVNEQMRRALEEDQYSARGSIVSDTDSEDDDLQYTYKGQSIRVDHSHLLQAARSKIWWGLGKNNNRGGRSASINSANAEDADANRKTSAKKKKGKRTIKDDEFTAALKKMGAIPADDLEVSNGPSAASAEKESERDESSIFGQTTGSSNSTWVECDKCGKWRRLRGVVDTSKLPKFWYCALNKTDPARASCSAPEEPYEDTATPENAADSRSRKHFRIWVRRLQCHEDYEHKQPTQTRGQKRATARLSKDPYEWIRCSNSSCGKWRALLPFMDAKSVMEGCPNGEWYCVMNTWDEKMASCAAPQENLPAVDCPPWVMQD